MPALFLDAGFRVVNKCRQKFFTRSGQGRQITPESVSCVEDYKMITTMETHKAGKYDI